MANTSVLISSIEDVQQGIQAVTQDIYKFPDLLAHYKANAEALTAFAARLTSLQGKLKGGGALANDDLMTIVNESNQTIIPQMMQMVATNTEILGMGQLNTQKNIRDTNAKALNDKLNALRTKIDALCVNLQAVTVADSPKTKLKIVGTPVVASPPSLAALTDQLKGVVDTMKQSEPQNGA